MATAHNAAEKGMVAKTVLMPGDPLRAKFIAETYLTDVTCFNTVRGMLGYTGLYKGRPVSVMGSGMGMPSIGIYSYELYHFFDVDNIVRIGSAGALSADCKLRQLVFAIGACTNSHYGDQFRLPGTFAPTASYGLLQRAVDIAKGMNVNYQVGNVLSSDTFYDDANSGLEWGKMGVLCVEMESAALYMNAARAGKQALSILTISDNLATGEETTAEERQTTFTQMMEVALELAVELEGED